MVTLNSKWSSFFSFTVHFWCTGRPVVDAYVDVLDNLAVDAHVDVHDKLVVAAQLEVPDKLVVGAQDEVPDKTLMEA